MDPEADELVAGRRPVEEAFVARREARRLLVVPQRRQALEKLVLHATNLRIPIVEVEGGTLTALAGFDGHQGVALVVGAPPVRRGRRHRALGRSSGTSRHSSWSSTRSRTPRTWARCCGARRRPAIHGVVFPTRRQAPLSPSAVKASAGAVEHLLLAPVDDLAGTLADLHVRGLRIVGADADAPLTVREADLRGPLALVVGSEGQGLGPAIRRRCDLLVRIPMRGSVGSLNASVAGSILLYEASTQRGSRREPSPDEAVPSEVAVAEAVVETASETTAVVSLSSSEAEPVAPAPAKRRPSHEEDGAGRARRGLDRTSATDLLPGGPEPGS